MPSYDLEWTLEMIGDGLPDGLAVEVMVDYDYRFGCGPSWEHPGDPDEIEITAVKVGHHIGPGPYDFRWDPLSLVPDEYDRVETYIINNPPDDDYYPEDY